MKKEASGDGDDEKDRENFLFHIFVVCNCTKNGESRARISMEMLVALPQREVAEVPLMPEPSARLRK